MNRFKLNRWIKALFVGVVAVLIMGGLAFWSNNQQAQADDSLMGVVLQKADVPMAENWLNDGSFTVDTLSQPLNTTNWQAIETAKVVLNYQTAYGRAADLKWQGEWVFMGSYGYAYGSEKEASEAANHILAQQPQVGATTLLAEVNQNGVKGQSYRMIGDEGDILFGFVGTRDNVLILFVTDSFSEKAGQEAFDQLLGKLVEKVS